MMVARNYPNDTSLMYYIASETCCFKEKDQTQATASRLKWNDYLAISLVIVGLIINTMLIAIVRFKDKSIRNASSVESFAIAIPASCAISLLVTGATVLQGNTHLVFVNSKYFCAITTYSGYVGHLLCSLYITEFTLDRFLAVCFPFKRRQWAWILHDKVIVGGTTTAALLVCSWSLFAFTDHAGSADGESHCSLRASFKSIQLHFDVTVMNIFTFLVPCVVLITCNLFVSHRINKGYFIVNPSTNFDDSVRTTVHRNLMLRRRRAVATRLITASLVYLVLNTPMNIIRLMIQFSADWMVPLVPGYVPWYVIHLLYALFNSQFCICGLMYSAVSLKVIFMAAKQGATTPSTKSTRLNNKSPQVEEVKRPFVPRRVFMKVLTVTSLPNADSPQLQHEQTAKKRSRKRKMMSMMSHCAVSEIEPSAIAVAEVDTRRSISEQDLLLPLQMHPQIPPEMPPENSTQMPPDIRGNFPRNNEQDLLLSDAEIMRKCHEISSESPRNQSFQKCSAVVNGSVTPVTTKIPDATPDAALVSPLSDQGLRLNTTAPLATNVKTVDVFQTTTPLKGSSFKVNLLFHL